MARALLEQVRVQRLRLDVAAVDVVAQRVHVLVEQEKLLYDVLQWMVRISPELSSLR